MGELLDAAPIAAAAFAIPQLLKLRATDDTAGVSWPWAALTSVNNCAWLGYFALSAYWAALVPSSSATLLAGALAVMLARRGQARARPAVLIGGWVALLATAFAVAGRSGLGTLLTAAFVVQVTPSVWTAYRTARPTGISRGYLAPHPRRAVLLDDLRRPQVRSAPDHPWPHRGCREPAHARPDPPHDRNPTVNSTQARQPIRARRPASRLTPRNLPAVSPSAWGRAAGGLDCRVSMSSWHVPASHCNAMPSRPTPAGSRGPSASGPDCGNSTWTVWAWAGRR